MCGIFRTFSPLFLYIRLYTHLGQGPLSALIVAMFQYLKQCLTYDICSINICSKNKCMCPLIIWITVYFKIYSALFLLTFCSILVSNASSHWKVRSLLVALFYFCLYIACFFYWCGSLPLHFWRGGSIHWYLYYSYSILHPEFILFLLDGWWFINFLLEHLALSTPTRFWIKNF